MPRTIDRIDYFVGLWEEADEYAREHIPEDIRERANENADPDSELRSLVVVIAMLSDKTRQSVASELRAARDLIAEHESRHETRDE